MSELHLPSTTINETQNRNDFRIMWIGSKRVPNVLKHFDKYLEEYPSCQAYCEEHTMKFENEPIFLVILKDRIPEKDFENLPQIRSIYILKEECQNLEYDPTDHKKLVGIFENINTLIERLYKYILLAGDLPISICRLDEIKNQQSLTKLNGNTLMFLCDQLFIFYLVNPINPNMDKLKRDMLEQCELNYKNNKVQLDCIKSFGENCSDDNALEWYTKDSFLYRILNTAFRMGNIDFMCKFQYFIIHLYKNFQTLSKSQEKNLSIVYRGQIMNKNELEKLKSNVGCMISINTILSTSRSEETALSFILGTEDGVIFKINIPKQCDNSFIPFIDISKFSNMPSEEEVLFFIGTVFSIDSIETESGSPCIIKLTLNNDPYYHFRKLISIFAPQFQEITGMFLLIMGTSDIHTIIQGYIDSLMDPFIREIKEKCRLIMKTDDFNIIEKYYEILTGKKMSSNNNPTFMIYIHFAFFFSNLGLYEKAIDFYKQAISLNNISMESPEFIVIHIIIGYLYYHLSQYDEASMAFGIVLSLLNEENLLTSELYRHIADMQKKRDKVDTSLSYYQDALRIANNRYIPSLRHIYQEIINILGDSHDAAAYESQLEEIDPNKYYISLSTWGDPTMLQDCRSRLNNDDKPIERADLLYKIGLHCVAQGHFEEALEHLLPAKDLYINHPPSRDRFHRHLPALFDNVAMLYLYSKDYLKSLIMWRKAIDIRTSSFLLNES